MEKELRLGNLVYGFSNKPFKVVRISTPQFENRDDEEDCNIIVENLEKKDYYTRYSSKSIRPIELTEEWLLKFGFEKDKDDNFSLNFNKEIFTLLSPFQVAREQKYYIFKISYCGLPRYKELKYVHQLQNLFFALTETELIINK